MRLPCASGGDGAGPSPCTCDILFGRARRVIYSATEILHVLSNPGPVFHYVVEPLCQAMDPGQSVCVRPRPCIEPAGTYQFVVLRWTDGSQPQKIGTVCFDDDESEGFGVITEDAIIKRMKGLDWPSAKLVVEPPNGKTLVNLRDELLHRAGRSGRHPGADAGLSRGGTGDADVVHVALR